MGFVHPGDVLKPEKDSYIGRRGRKVFDVERRKLDKSLSYRLQGFDYEDFPGDEADFMTHYCVASGQIGSSLMPVIIGSRRLKVGDNTTFTYGSSEVVFKRPYDKIGVGKRMLLRPEIMVQNKGNELARLDVTFPFVVFGSDSKVPVAVFKKTVLVNKLVRN